MSNIREINNEFFGTGGQAQFEKPYLRALKNARQKLIAIKEETGWEGSADKMSVYITSIEWDEDNKEKIGGQVCEATGMIASMRMAEHSHRLSTQQEIDRFRKEQAQRDKWCLEEMRKKQTDGGAMLKLAEALTNTVQSSGITLGSNLQFPNTNGADLTTDSGAPIRPPTKPATAGKQIT